MSWVICIIQTGDKHLHLATIFLQLVAKTEDFFNVKPCNPFCIFWMRNNKFLCV